MPARARRRGHQACAWLLIACTLASNACIPETALTPSAGLRQGQALDIVSVPGGVVNSAGGNLLVRRVDLSIDTVLGTQEIGAVYNSSSGEWLWSFQLSYDGERFVDPSGAVWNLPVLPESYAVPGSFWVRDDGDTIRSRGGLAYHFGSDAKLAWLAWATLPYPRLEFDATEIRQCISAASCSTLFELEIDAAGRPVAVHDARTGRRAEFSYDALGRLVQARDALDVEKGWPGSRYEYSAGGTLLTAFTNSENERIEYRWQGERRILEVTQVGEGDPTHRFEFYGRDATLERWPTLHTNPLGGRTRYLYDNLRRLRSIERESSGEVTFVEWASARPSLITEPSGATTAFEVDVNDDVVRVIEPSGNIVTYTYAPDAIDPDHPFARPVQRIEDSLGVVAQLEYDGQGRTVRLELAEGEVFESTYSVATRTRFHPPFGDPLSFESYGLHGHWLEASTPASEFPIRRAFDAVGNLQVPAAGLQEGGVLLRSYDGDRNLARIDVAASAAGRVTSSDYVDIERRSDGRPSAYRRPRGADHEIVHDALGRAVRVRERSAGSWHETLLEYDLAGNLTARERPNGMRDEFGYDEYGRLVRRAALRHGVLEGQAHITWSGGLPASFSDSRRATTEFYSYDGAGRLSTISWSSGEWIELDHDLRSRVVEQAFHLPGGASRTLGTRWDGANRQTHLTLDGTETLLEIHYADTKEVSVRYGNGLVRDAGYDPGSGRLTGFTTRDPGAALVEETTLSHWVDGPGGAFEITSSTTTPLASSSETYRLGLAGSLTDLDKLVGNRVWGWSDHTGSAQTYVYDELSNRVDGAGDTFGYDAERSRLLTASFASENTSVDYAWDEAGFATSRGGVPLQWTATGNLASLGAVAIEWDLVNRPISVSAGPLRRDFVLFGGAVSSDPDTGAVGAIDLGSVQVPFAGDERLYRHFDFRHNVSFVSDESGQVLTHYWYHAYGLEGIEGVAIDTRRFASHHDLGDGLAMLGLRVYDARVGRFLSPDPLLQPLNQFAYTLGNPVHFLDAGGAQPTPRGDPGTAAANPVDAAVRLATATVALAAAVAVAAGAPSPVSYAGVAAASAYFYLALEAYQAAKEAASAPPAEEATPSGRGSGGSLSFALDVGVRELNVFGFPPLAAPCYGSPSALAHARPERALPTLALLALACWLAAGAISRRSFEPTKRR